MFLLVLLQYDTPTVDRLRSRMLNVVMFGVADSRGEEETKKECEGGMSEGPTHVA